MVFRETLGVTVCAIALTVTCLTGAAPATAANASPARGVQLPLEPSSTAAALPTQAELLAAKSDPERLQAMVEQLESAIEQARLQIVNAEARALDAQDSLLAADELLQERAQASMEARSEAEKATDYLLSSKKEVGALASDLYRNGGINPGVVNLLDNDADSDVLYKASTMGALTANRARTVNAAEEAAALWKAWQDYADAAETAANEATAAQRAATSEASSTMSAYQASVAPHEKLRSEIIEQLAFLRDVDVKEEAARIAAKEAAAEAARLQELLDNTPANAPVRNENDGVSDFKPLAAPPKVPTERPQDNSLIPKPTNPAPPGNTPVAPEPVPNNPEPEPEPEKPTAKPIPTPEAPKPTPTPEKPKPTPTPEAPKPTPTPTPEKPKPTPTPEKPTPPVDEVAPPSSNSFNAAISWAHVIANDESKGYIYGANGPDNYDCSSYSRAAFAKSGVYLPRTSTQQYAAAPTKVPLSQLRRGDLVFSSSNGGKSFYHVAIYLGNGQVIHARNPAAGISVAPLSWVNNLHPYAGRF